MSGLSEREGALRKVRALLAQAASTTFEGEAATYREKAVELRLRFGISDADLAVAIEMDGEELSFFGRKLFWYSRAIKPHLERIKAEIATAFESISREDLRNEVESISRLAKDLREIADSVRERRDDAVRRVYEFHVKERLEDYEEHERAEARLSPRVHDSAVTWTRLDTDLRSDHIERIVGVSSKKLWERQLRFKVCEHCGLDGNDGRDLVGLFDNPITQEREFLHPGCVPQKEVTTT